MGDKINRNTFIAILAAVLVATAANQIMNPLAYEEVEEDTWWYNRAGVNFEGDPGMRFNYSKLGTRRLSYEEGYSFRVRYENETHLPNMAFAWDDAMPMNLNEAAYMSYNRSDVDAVYAFGETFNVSVHEHWMIYSEFDRVSEAGNRTGYVGYWNCTNSARTITVIVEHDIEGNRTDLFRIFNHTRVTITDHYPGQRPRSEGTLDLPFDVDTLINVALMIMLTIGFSFTYMMEGFPNFAHTSYAGLGAMVSFILARFFDFNAYDTWPFAALVGGIFGVVLYIGIVKRIRQHGGYQDITLTLTFIVVAQVLPYFYLIFNYWARYFGDVPAQGYYLGYYDFSYQGIPGIAIISSATCIFLIIGLRYFLTQNKIGLSLRAVAESEDLAATIGINTDRAHYASWFISGALSALVGSIMTIHGGTRLGGTDDMIINVMSGAIMGGVYNVYGAIIGGLFVSLSQKLLNTLFYNLFGLAVMNWQGLFPMGFLVLALFVFPNGITGPGGIDKQRLINLWSRIKKMLGITQEGTAS